MRLSLPLLFGLGVQLCTAGPCSLEAGALLGLRKAARACPARLRRPAFVFDGDRGCRRVRACRRTEVVGLYGSLAECERDCADGCPPPPPPPPPPPGCVYSPVLGADGCPQSELYCTAAACADVSVCPKACDRCICDLGGIGHHCLRNATCEEMHPCMRMRCTSGSVCKVVFGEGHCVAVDINPCARIRCGVDYFCKIGANKQAVCVLGDPCAWKKCLIGTTCVIQGGIGVCVPHTKPGACPPVTGPGPCVEYCSADSDCPGPDKCCSNGCGHMCMAPVDPDPCTAHDCPAGTTCIVVHGSAVCVGLSLKPGSCSSAAVSSILAPSLGVCSAPCNADWDCPGTQKCCPSSCGGKRCQEPGNIKMPGFSLSG